MMKPAAFLVLVLLPTIGPRALLHGQSVSSEFEYATISPTSSVGVSFFGDSACLDGDRAIVVAPTSFGFSGAAYVFQRNGQSWTQVQALNGCCGNGIEFGASVSLNGSLLAIGQPGSFPRVWVFAHNGTQWILNREITSPDGNSGFGGGVAITPTMLVATAPSSVSVPGGAVHVYVPVSGTWTKIASLAAPSNQILLSASSIAVHGDRFAVADMQNQRVRVFQRNDNGTPGTVTDDTFTATVIASPDGAGINFGFTVDMGEDVLVVGAPQADVQGQDSGAVYVFEYAGGQWIPTQRLLASNGSALDQLGFDVALDGDLIAATNTGRKLVHVYERSGTTWTEALNLAPSGTGSHAGFGQSVALSGKAAVVGFDSFTSRVHAYDWSVPRTPLVKVVMGDERRPLLGVTVDALRTTGSGTELVSIGTSDAEGLVRVLPAQVPQGSGWRLRATLTYQDQIHSSPTQVRNYVGWDPTRTLELGAPGFLAEIAYPDPVALQAGLWGGTQTWSRLQTYLSADPGTDASKSAQRIPGFLSFAMPSAEQAPGFGYDSSLPPDTQRHDVNGARLRDWIRSRIEPLALTAFLASEDILRLRYSLVGHSMGGLIVRALTTRPGELEFRAVVSLDGVHGGTRLAEWFGTGLSESKLNERGPDGGWNWSHFQLFGPPWLLYSCSALPPFCVQGIVSPDASAFGVGRVTSARIVRFVSGAQKATEDRHSSLLGLQGIVDNPDRQRELALYLAWGIPPPLSMHSDAGMPDLGCSADFASHSRKEGVAAGSVRPSLQRTTLVPAGSTMSEPFFNDADAGLRLSLIVQGFNAGYALEDVHGTPLVPSSITTEGVGETAVRSLAVYENAPVGELTLTVSAGTAWPSEAHWTVDFGGNRTLHGECVPNRVAAGAPIRILARFRVGPILVLLPAGIEAEVISPEGVKTSMMLLDDGLHGDGRAQDGTYGHVFMSTSAAGIYDVRFEGLTELSGRIVQRSASADFAVIPDSAAFHGPPIEATVDLDGDDLYDELRFLQSVLLAENGTFSVCADLQDRNGLAFQVLRASIENDAGATTVDVALSVPGELLALHRVPGPWTLENLRIVVDSADSLVADRRSAYTTSVQDVGVFDPPPPPVIAQAFPSSVSAVGGETVSITGAHLDGVDEVRIGGVVAAIVGRSSLVIQVVAPSLHETSIAGTPIRGLKRRETVALELRSPWGNSTLEAALTYE